MEASRALADGEVTSRLQNVVRLRGPGYPLFLAALFKVAGVRLGAVFAVQAVLGALTCAWIYGIAASLSGRAAGLAAGGLTALYPPLVLHTGLPLGETFSTCWFWLGVLLAIHGARAASRGPLVAGGLAVAVACLSRPTLLPVIPFLALGVFLALDHGHRRRIAPATAFAAAMVLPVLAWTAYATSIGLQPVAGAAGAEMLVKMIGYGSLPEYRGWAPHGLAIPGWPGWEPLARLTPTAVVVGAANLAFHHLWFAENLWRAPLVVSPHAIDVLHRGLLLLATAGLAVATRGWKTYAPLLGVAAGAALGTLQFIEPRKVLPFAPLLAILAAAFVAAVLSAPRARAWAWAAGSAALATLACHFDGGGLVALGSMVPSVPLATLGRALDVAAVLAMVGWGWASLSVLPWAKRPALAIALAPFLGLAGLFAAYAITRSGPRWRDWQVGDGETMTVRVAPAVPITAVERARWMVDLEADPAPASWRREFCPTAEEYICSVFDRIAAYDPPGLAAERQWWSIDVDPATLEGRGEATLVLGPASPALKIGGTIDEGAATLRPAIDPGRASLYRWLVLDDWRRWDTFSGDAGVVTVRMQGPRGRREGRLAQALGSGEARVNVHLLVTLRDGRRLVF